MTHGDCNRPLPAGLWEEPADESGFGDAADGEDHGAGARRIVMLAHGVHHFVEGADHDFLEARVYFVDVPHEAFVVVHPLKVADRGGTGVGEYIRQHDNAAPREDFVSVRRGGAVGGFRDDAGLDGLGVVQGDDVFERGRYQDVALHGQQFVVGDARRAGHADDRAGTLLVTNGFDGVDTAGVGDAAAGVAEGDDFSFLFREQARGSRSGVAEALNGDGRSAERDFFQLAGFFDDVEKAARGGFAASFGTANGNGFAGDDTVRGMSDGHRIGIHDPGHRLRVGVNIRRGNAHGESNDRQNLPGVTAAHTFEFALGYSLWIAKPAPPGPPPPNA